ncbi:MAG: large ribosomal subunit protein bL28 [Patescibacteria group bacterium]
MAKKCDLCSRSATKGASRSHSKIKTLKRQNINLQTKMIEGLKARICTSCMRTMVKPKRVKAKRKPALKEGEVKALKVKKAGAKSAAKKIKKAAVRAPKKK